MHFLKKEQRSPGGILLCGYILLFAVFELVGIPIVLTVTYHGFSVLSAALTVSFLLLAAAGAGITLWGRKKGNTLRLINTAELKKIKLEEKIVFLLFLLIVGFQLYMAFTRASFDGDDAYYNVQAVIAQQIDTLYRINPNTGRSAPLDVRHCLALFPIWEAYIGKMSGVHATIISHSVIPLILIPLTYLLYYQIGRLLFGNKKEMLPMFMALTALWQMFGNISIYTNETFFLTRTWQGKSFAGNFIIPAVFWIFLLLFSEEKSGSAGGFFKWDKKPGEAQLWVLLALVNLAGGASSSLAVLLSTMLTAGLGFLLMLRRRRFFVLVKAGLSCITSGVYVFLYVALTHGVIKL